MFAVVLYYKENEVVENVDRVDEEILIAHLRWRLSVDDIQIVRLYVAQECKQNQLRVTNLDINVIIVEFVLY